MKNKMSSPKISVIIPVYNVEKYLRRCLDSLIIQTFSDFEVILVDDGSPDNCGKICDEYLAKDARFRVFHKENGGVSSARNLALDNIQGEWVTFIDSDDWVEVAFLQDLYEGVSENVDMVACGFDRVSDVASQRQLIFSPAKLDVLESFKAKDFHLYLLPFAKLYKSVIIKNKNLRFNENLHLHEDTLFIFEYLVYARCVQFIDSIEYKYYINSASLSTRFNPFYEEYYLFYLGLKRLLEHYKDSPSFYSYLKMACKDSIVSMYRPKVYIKDRKTRLANMKMLYSEQADIIDIFPSKSILKLLRNHHSLLDLFLKIYYSPRFYSTLSRLRNICLGRKNSKNNAVPLIIRR